MGIHVISGIVRWNGLSVCKSQLLSDGMIPDCSNVIFAQAKGYNKAARLNESLYLSASPDLAGKQSRPTVEVSVSKSMLAMTVCVEGVPDQLLMSIVGVMADASSGFHGGGPDTDTLQDLKYQWIMASFQESNS